MQLQNYRYTHSEIYLPIVLTKWKKKWNWREKNQIQFGFQRFKAADKFQSFFIYSLSFSIQSILPYTIYKMWSKRKKIQIFGRFSFSHSSPYFNFKSVYCSVIWCGSFKQNTHDRSWNITHSHTLTYKTILHSHCQRWSSNNSVSFYRYSLSFGATRCHNTKSEHYDLFQFFHRKNTQVIYIYRMVGDLDVGRKK